METELFGLSQFRGTSYEQCGLIVSSRKSIRVVKVKNSAENLRENYRISRLSMAIARARLKSGEKIVGFIHTHLPHHPATPSEVDLQGAARNPGSLHAVYKPNTGEITWYKSTGPRTREGL